MGRPASMVFVAFLSSFVQAVGIGLVLKFSVNHFRFGRGDCQRIAPVILV
jgi:hypothetical protein